MVSRVYFSDFRSRSAEENKGVKIRRLLKIAGEGIIDKDDLTAVKLHFGEEGCDGFIRPIFVRKAVDWVREQGGKPFLTDTNTLYTGSRKNSVDHLVTAIEHGFGYAVTGAPIIIADGLKSESFTERAIDGRHFSSVKIASDIATADAIVVLSHFKGHVMAGFGGAVKNLAMGCAPAQGKKEQHSARMSVDIDRCIGCGRCFRNCPVSAITMNNCKACIDKDICIGCGECLTVCPASAISLDWKTDLLDFQQRMSEYAYGSVVDKTKKMVYLNFVMNVTPQCDCVPWSDAPIVADIGFLASTDPVALDMACLDMVNRKAAISGTALGDSCGCSGEVEDKFTSLYEKIDHMEQLRHAQRMGLGSLEYEIEEI